MYRVVPAICNAQSCPMKKTYPHATQLAKAIGREIRTLRIEKEYTQEQLAAILDLDSNSISNFETAAVNPSVLTLLAIAAALNASPAELFAAALADFERRSGKSLADAYGLTGAHVARQLTSLKRKRVTAAKKRAA